MLNDISSGGWLVILSLMALGFGLVRFLVVSMRDKLHNSAPKHERAAEDQAGFGTRSEKSDTNAESSRRENSDSNRPPQNWYEVLGVTANASLDQIRTAYRKRMALYHPDKVSALGPEFSVVAERMTKEINAAYERGIAARSKWVVACICPGSHDGSICGRAVRPNPSIERTRNGMPRMALISFWAMRVLPLRAAHVKR